MTDYSSIVASIFKRKGAEGKLTKILTNENSAFYQKALSFLNDDEKGLVIYFKDQDNWTLLTSFKILSCHAGNISQILFNDIASVKPALHEELRDGIKDLKKFTRLNVEKKNGVKTLIYLEQGKPYNGFYQALHFISTRH
jgi:hypothetical protein